MKIEVQRECDAYAVAVSGPSGSWLVRFDSLADAMDMADAFSGWFPECEVTVAASDKILAA